MRGSAWVGWPALAARDVRRRACYREVVTKALIPKVATLRAAFDAFDEAKGERL